MTVVFNLALIKYLKEKDSVYFGKIQELRNAIEGWLSYVPQTFPHYTRHTLQHSDEIVGQLSYLLFSEDCPDKPVVGLSSTEIYILIASAYLHDAGMVVSDKDKAAILLSDEWKSWSSGSGDGAKRWHHIQEFRQTASEDADRQNFLADIQSRFLIAEFLRRTHHQRTASIIAQHQATLARFAFDDPMLTRTIADICLAHGLRQYELADSERFPERRDIKGDKVNVKFMAILLRIGDLLDMSCDRACPLLLNAACPLPPESFAHWFQYQRIFHRMTAPDRIEITAACETQEEHRYLQDWCQWLVDELKEARNLMTRATRHSDWTPPTADIGSTIVIRPSKKARYIPSKWVFELDNDAIFDLLIRKPYADPFAFIRELIQNALDATRCQLYADIIAEGKEPPEFPTQIEKQRLERYPLKISLVSRKVMNHLSGETESRQALIIDDCGIGMDREIIERYFLQVGRSYYTTDEFQRSFRFMPTSRFGIGFLSVFASSEHVVVESYKPSSHLKDGPIRLTLTGPRNYLLTDCGTRRSSGTYIEVLLRERLENGKLTKIVSQWCRKVEFPIMVDDLGYQTIITAETPDQFTYEVPDVTEDNAKFIVRSFPVNRPGIEGDLYVFARINKSGESWAKRRWAISQYPSKHPAAAAPRIPNSLVCLHGIALNRDDRDRAYMHNSMISRIDYRRQIDSPNLSREMLSSNQHRILNRRLDMAIQSRWEEILREHLATTKWVKSKDAWKYKQDLYEEYDDLSSFWASENGMIPILIEGEERFVSLAFVQSLPIIGTTTSERHFINRYDYYNEWKQDEPIPILDRDTPFIIGGNLKYINGVYKREIFNNRKATNVRWLINGYLAIDWILSDDKNFLHADNSMMITELSEPDTIGLTVHKITSTDYILINGKHKFIQWLLSIRTVCRREESGLIFEQYEILVNLLRDSILYGNQYLDKLVAYFEGWKKLPGLSPDLYPPAVTITGEMFVPERIRAKILDRKKEMDELRKNMDIKIGKRREKISKLGKNTKKLKEERNKKN